MATAGEGVDAAAGLSLGEAAGGASPPEAHAMMMRMGVDEIVRARRSTARH